MAAAVRYDLIEDVAVLTLDRPPVNASSAGLRRQLAAGLDRAAASAAVGVVIMGAHDTFIAGSDLTEFDEEVLPEPQLPAVIRTIEALPVPVVAALDGHALGGGLELALACDARVATARVVLGLPEVTLGMVPGAGGTQRLPRAIGRAAALDMIVCDSRCDGVTARERGLVDEIAEPADLLSRACARSQVIGKRALLREPVPADPRDVLSDAVARATAVTRIHPNAGEAIRLVQCAGSGDADTMLEDERATFQRLRLSDEARTLRERFFAERRAARRLRENCPARRP
ncbi:hypothetical protein F8568_043200 [Actinomadura sp. LD22]|uniref:Enoyl-CoA hydratase/isomerase family protein n=1 Tax=Actinomadura physcomitrii TaxID=2650748 RepID=A0A6I4MQL7_9ACTN|nr:enoyl-CoA hydratase/isomerase family protein [Actinomadura physcomitrii]MWA07035.1 hypothetical protein [Actinomadura physcomitrii]